MQDNAVFGHFKPLRHVGKEPLDDRRDFATEDALVRAGKAGVRQIRGAAGKDLLISSLHVRVRADDGADLAINHARKRDFFRRGFGMEIHENNFGLFAQFFYLVEPGQKRVFQGWHEGAALQVQDGDQAGRSEARGPRPDRKNSAPWPGRAGRIVQRSQEAFFIRQEFHDFFLIPQMVPAGDDVHTGGKDFLGDPRGNARAAGGIFSIGDNEIQCVPVAKFREQFLDRAPPWLPHDIANEKKFHAVRLISKSPIRNRQ